MFNILIAQKWANLEDLKSKITLHKRKINNLTYPGMTSAHQSVITLETRLNTEHKAMAATAQAKLVAFWDDQESLVKTTALYLSHLMPSSSASLTVSKLSQPVLFVSTAPTDENMNFITSARPVIYNSELNWNVRRNLIELLLRWE
jgi:hypothetical protein